MVVRRSLRVPDSHLLQDSVLSLRQQRDPDTVYNDMAGRSGRTVVLRQHVSSHFTFNCLFIDFCLNFHRYNILFLLLTYVVPIISMIFTYSLIARELWGHKAIGESTEFQKESIRSKRKIVRMLMVVVAIFAICWWVEGLPPTWPWEWALCVP